MLPKQTNYTNLRQNLASILDEAIAERDVIIFTRQGKEEVAIISRRFTLVGKKRSSSSRPPMSVDYVFI